LNNGLVYGWIVKEGGALKFVEAILVSLTLKCSSKY